MPNYLLRKDTGELEFVTGTEPFTVTPAEGNGTYDVYRLDNSAAVTVTSDDVAPSVENLTATVCSQNEATLRWSTDEANGNAYWVCTTSTTVPSPEQIKAGQNHTGAVSVASGVQSVVEIGAQRTDPVDGLQNGQRYSFHLIQEDESGNTSATLTTNIDVRIPILDLSASVSGTAATLSWSTDEDNGTGFWVCTTSVVAPSVTQIIAGENHTGSAAVSSGVQTVLASGEQADQVVTDLSEGSTYFFHLLHRDAIGNTSVRVSTAGVTVASSGGASAQINILERSNLEIAPEALTFDLTLTDFDTPGPAVGEVYDPQFHELYYLWDFGDDYTFTAPLNLITEHNKAGVSYGPKVTHTYRSAGTYNVSCLVVEPSSGKTVTANLSVVVGDADAQFAGANTIFVSPTSDWTDAPAGAIRETSFNGAWSRLKLFSDARRTPKRIMLNRGETYDLVSGMGFTGNANDQISSVHVCSGPGAGAKPILAATGTDGFSCRDSSNNSSGIDTVFYGLDCIGPWDSQTETGNSPVMFFVIHAPMKYFLMDDCTVTGFAGLYSANQFDNPAYAYLSFNLNDTVVTDRRSYGMLYDTGSVLSVVGSRIDSHVNANAGGPQGTHNDAGPIRTAGGDNIIITNSSMFSRSGWTAVGSTQVYQPVIRANASGKANAAVNCQANSLEGKDIYTQTMSNGGTQAVAMNQIIDKNYFLGCSQVWNFIRSTTGGLTVRNNIFVNPAVDRNLISTNQFNSYVLMYDHGNSTAETYTSPVKVYNNTMVNLQSDAQYPRFSNIVVTPEIDAAAAFTDVLVENNVRYQPNTTTAYVSDAPLETSPALFAPLEQGYKDSSTPLITGTATPENTAASYMPQIGSSALGDASNGHTAYDDYFGFQRPQYPSRGATEIR